MAASWYMCLTSRTEGPVSVGEMQEEGKVEPIFPVVTDFLSNYDTTYGWATVTKCSTRP